MQLVTCPGCGGAMQLTADLAGQQALCPHCGGAVMMPPIPPPFIPTALPASTNYHSNRPNRFGGCAVLGVVILIGAFLVCVVGVVIVGSMVSVGYTRIQQGALKNAASTQISFLEDAVKMYALHVGSPPTNRQGLDALVTPPTDPVDPSKWDGPYLERAPLPLDPWNNQYHYELIDEESVQFRIWSNGPDGTAGTADDIATSLM